MLNNTDIVILAGGLGKRLHTVTQGKQKVLADIDGKPFIALLIEFIASQGAKRFILCTGHGAEDVKQALAGMFPKLDIMFSIEQDPLGTGGAIKQGAALVRSPKFIAMNGDCFCVIDYQKLLERHAAQKAAATIAITKVDDAREYGTIEVDAQGRIKAFKEKSASAELLSRLPAGQAGSASADKQPQYLINTGTYCLNKDVFSMVKTPAKFSIEYDFFPHLVGKGFASFEVPNKFIDIGTPERYHWAQEHLKGLRS